MKYLSALWWRIGMIAGMAILPKVAMAADDIPQGLSGGAEFVGKIGEGAGLKDTSLTTIIGNIINVALGFLGIVLLAYLLYAGFLWMTAGGETEKVTKAQDMIKNAIIGLIIIIAAFAISNFVLKALIKATA
ncbi:hypothetical protein KKE33_02705 [Patescibacteria group bacterium]|nr:hypothetical protein [Patescibacteria group bacterium]